MININDISNSMKIVTITTYSSIITSIYNKATSVLERVILDGKVKWRIVKIGDFQPFSQLLVLEENAIILEKQYQKILRNRKLERITKCH
jgi:hypothetical protein